MRLISKIKYFKLKIMSKILYSLTHMMLFQKNGLFVFSQVMRRKKLKFYTAPKNLRATLLKELKV